MRTGRLKLDFRRLAKAGLDVSKLLADMDRVDSDVRGGEADARAAGVRSTPTFALVQPSGPPLRLGLSGLVIDAICQWCVTSDAIMLALAVLTVVRLRPLVS